MAVQRVDGDERVTALELFFDLVFVFAITQVTTLMVGNPTWGGLGEGMLVLTALWFGWASYAWLTNTVNPEEGGVRLAYFGAMAAFLVSALAVPHAFEDDALVFGVAYAAVRLLHLALYGLASREDPLLRYAIWRLARSMVTASALIVAAGLVDGTARYVLWGIALASEVAGPYVFGVTGWRVHPHHFVERHGLVVIIALGESIVAVGAAASHDLSFALVLGAVFGLSVAGAIWWSYFDVAALVAERRLAQQTGDAMAKQARDSYTYLHLPMVAGIILFAFGCKRALGHAHEALDYVGAIALCGGVALYLAAHIAFRLRNTRTWNKQRCVAVIILVALIPICREVDAIVALALVTATTCGLIVYEAIRFKQVRDRVRHAQEILVSQ